MPRFLIAAAVQVEAESELEAVAFARSIALEVEEMPQRYAMPEDRGWVLMPKAELLIPDPPRVEFDPDSVIDPVLRNEEEMDHHPPFGDNLVTGDIEWLRTRERYGIRVDFYDVHRVGKRGLPLFGFRLSHHVERENPRPVAMQGQMGEDRRAREEGWEIIFTGEDYEPGPGHDNEMILADLLGFLASYDELTDSDATPRQKKWLTHYRDELSMWSADLEGELDDFDGAEMESKLRAEREHEREDANE